MFKQSALAAAIGGMVLGAGLNTPAYAANDTLTLFHNNDGESKIEPQFDFGTFQDFGGASQFTRLLRDTRDALPGTTDILTISSGDNWLAGPVYQASINSGTFFDALVLNRIEYDAITLGNHEFDFGTEPLADFIGQVDASVPFLSANLDFSGDANLSGLVGSRLLSSTIVNKNGTDYGIIGLTTTELKTTSSPGPGVDVMTNIAEIVNAEVASLEAAGVNRIVLSAHLQSINDDKALIPQLDGVDIVIAGGGGELLLNADNAKDSAGSAAGPYPVTTATDMDGTVVPIVTTTGNYVYFGQLTVEFDGNDEVVPDSWLGSDAVLVGPTDETTPTDPIIDATVVAPLEVAIAELDDVIIGETEVPLDGIRANIRGKETNLGNLITDAFRWQANQGGFAQALSGDPTIGLNNGGGIRNDDVRPVGDLSLLDTLEILPFDNTLAIINGVDALRLKDILENAVSRVESGSGRFAQISGIQFDYDPSRAVGDRVLEIRFENGALIFSGGVDEYGGTFDIVTNNFLLGGGDGYDFSGLESTEIGAGYSQALLNFIELGLGGLVTGEDYGVAGNGRINAVPVPGAVWLLASTIVGLLGFRRRPAPV